MFLMYTKSWWALVIRGLVAMIFGILAFVWPGITLLSLVFMFGIYALIDGAFAIVAGVRASQEHNRWWLLLLEGIISLGAGVLAFVLPGITALVLLLLISIWAIVTGVFEIGAAIQMRKHISNEWLLVVGGVLSILFGILLLARPMAGALALIWVIGFYAIFFGVVLFALGLKLRGLEHTAQSMMPRHA